MTAATLAELNGASQAQFVALLEGIYEHSPWIAERAWPMRPFASLAQLEHAMVRVVREAGRDAQLSLLRAHPELAGKAMVARSLTSESTHEQDKAGLTACTPQEFETVQRLNARYSEKFGWPFILAVRGPYAAPDAPGLTRAQIIASFERRLASHPDDELAECLRNVHRIAEIRLNDRFGANPALGRQGWQWCEQLAWHDDRLVSDPGFAEHGQLTVTYLGEAHRECAARLQQWMRESGFDEVGIDAVGNVVGVYRAAAEESMADRGTGTSDDAGAKVDRAAAGVVAPRAGSNDGSGPTAQTDQAPVVRSRRLLTGSHYDTVRDAGKYDGRLGIVLPMACVRELHRTGRRLPFAIEVVGFAEEEGQRYKATFLASSALTGQFDPSWLDQRDADGVAMRDAMRAAGLPGTLGSIAALKRDARDYLGFVEIHIEQGPVLAELGLPLGAVTSINGSIRCVGEARGVASHAGTTPMPQRRDAALVVAELALHAERRACEDADSVATVGQLDVPAGSINVVPGRCRFSLDMRAPNDAQRDRLAQDIREEARRIAERRGVTIALEETLRAAAAPSDAAWQARWEAAIASLGLPVHRMPSGAGHDAMKLNELMPQAMLFVRGENGGISHNPLESTTADDMHLAAQAFMHLLEQLAGEIEDLHSSDPTQPAP